MKISLRRNNPLVHGLIRIFYVILTTLITQNAVLVPAGFTQPRAFLLKFSKSA